jgi:hypothetical protein
MAEVSGVSHSEESHSEEWNSERGDGKATGLYLAR